jgi:hypothetical protein
MPRRLALLVATYRYQDEELQQLTAPGEDAEDLAEALRNPEIAGFDEVTVKLNEPHHVVGQAIGEFFHKRRRDDLTVLYFTGHGLKDEQGRLYLAMTDTRHDQLLFTGLSANQINEAMEASSSRQQLLILDCCYSGAYPGDRVPKADTKAHSLSRFEGTGRVILTASDAIQYAFQGDQVTGEGSGSVFTRFLVEGLTTGDADLDHDGNIALDELYAYAYDHVIAAEPRQHPQMLEHVEGRIVLAQNINWTLPDHIRHAVQSPFKEQRLAALEELKHLHVVGNDRVRTEVVSQTRTLAEDDSKSVSIAASELLAALGAGAVASKTEKVEAEAQARRDAEAERARLAEDLQARRGAEEAEARQREAEADRVRRAAEEEKARRDSEERIRREAEEKARREAAAKDARQREAEAERVRLAAEEDQARRAAQEEQARQAAEVERARRDAEGVRARWAAQAQDRSARVRWLAVGLLVVAVVILIASAPSMLDTVRRSRPQQPDSDAWLTLLWLLPAVPAIVAAAVLSVTRASGTAVACVAIAFLWVGASALNVWVLTERGGRAQHLALLGVLAAAGVAAALATPPIRARVGVNRPATLTTALVLLTLGIALGLAAAIDGPGQLAILERPTVWHSWLPPLLVGFPGAFIRGNPTQARAMLTTAVAYAGFLVLLLAGRLQAGTIASENYADEAVFLVATVCMVLAVLVGQIPHLRRPSHEGFVR